MDQTSANSKTYISNSSRNADIDISVFNQYYQPFTEYAIDIPVSTNNPYRSKSNLSKNLKCLVNGEEYSVTPLSKSKGIVEYDLYIQDEGHSLKFELVDLIDDKVISKAEANVLPHNYVHIDYNNGQVKLVGPKDETVEYSMNINGTNIKGARSIESDDSIYSSATSTSVSGKLNRGLVGKDVYEFSSLQYISVKTSTPMMFVLKNKPMSLEKSFSYKTPISSMLNNSLDFDDPDVKVRKNGIEATNIGVLRERMNMPAKVFNGSLMRKL